MIRTLIIEDETPAAIRLEKLLMEVEPETDVVGVLESVSSALDWFSIHPQPDLLMLDIQLADGLCFDIFRNVDVSSFVIFTTAFDEYAIKAFELNSIDYLLKPVKKERLVQSMAKFHSLQKRSPAFDLPSLLDAIERTRNQYKSRFAVNAGTRIRSIETSRVAYFYSSEKSTFLCTMENRHYPIDYSLERIEEMVEPDRFFRINRQAMISYQAIDRIQVLSKSRVAVHTTPATDEPFLVSTARTHTFRLWLDR